MGNFSDSRFPLHNNVSIFKIRCNMNVMQSLMVFFCVHAYRLLSCPIKRRQRWIIPADASPDYCHNLTPEFFPTMKTKSRWVLCYGEGRRLSLMSISELWSGNQLHLFDYIGLNPNKLDYVLKKLSYGDFVRWIGNSYHTSSCGHLYISSLMMDRMAPLGILKT